MTPKRTYNAASELVFNKKVKQHEVLILKDVKNIEFLDICMSKTEEEVDEAEKFRNKLKLIKEKQIYFDSVLKNERKTEANEEVMKNDLLKKNDFNLVNQKQIKNCDNELYKMQNENLLTFKKVCDKSNSPNFDEFENVLIEKIENKNTEYVYNETGMLTDIIQKSDFEIELNRDNKEKNLYEYNLFQSDTNLCVKSEINLCKKHHQDVKSICTLSYCIKADVKNCEDVLNDEKFFLHYNDILKKNIKSCSAENLIIDDKFYSFKKNLDIVYQCLKPLFNKIGKIYKEQNSINNASLILKNKIKNKTVKIDYKIVQYCDATKNQVKKINFDEFKIFYLIYLNIKSKSNDIINNYNCLFVKKELLKRYFRKLKKKFFFLEKRRFSRNLCDLHKHLFKNYKETKIASFYRNRLYLDNDENSTKDYFLNHDALIHTNFLFNKQSNVIYSIQSNHKNVDYFNTDIKLIPNQLSNLEIFFYNFIFDKSSILNSNSFLFFINQKNKTKYILQLICNFYLTKIIIMDDILKKYNQEKILYNFFIFSDINNLKLYLNINEKFNVKSVLLFLDNFCIVIEIEKYTNFFVIENYNIIHKSNLISTKYGLCNIKNFDFYHIMNFSTFYAIQKIAIDRFTNSINFFFIVETLFKHLIYLEIQKKISIRFDFLFDFIANEDKNHLNNRLSNNYLLDQSRNYTNNIFDKNEFIGDQFTEKTNRRIFNKNFNKKIFNTNFILFKGQTEKKFNIINLIQKRDKLMLENINCTTNISTLKKSNYQINCIDLEEVICNSKKPISEITSSGLEINNLYNLKHDHYSKNDDILNQNIQNNNELNCMVLSPKDNNKFVNIKKSINPKIDNMEKEAQSETEAHDISAIFNEKKGSKEINGTEYHKLFLSGKNEIDTNGTKNKYEDFFFQEVNYDKEKDDEFFMTDENFLKEQKNDLSQTKTKIDFDENNKIFNNEFAINVFSNKNFEAEYNEKFFFEKDKIDKKVNEKNMEKNFSIYQDFEKKNFTDNLVLFNDLEKKENEIKSFYEDKEKEELIDDIFNFLDDKKLSFDLSSNLDFNENEIFKELNTKNSLLINEKVKFIDDCEDFKILNYENDLNALIKEEIDDEKNDSVEDVDAFFDEALEEIKITKEKQEPLKIELKEAKPIVKIEKSTKTVSPEEKALKTKEMSEFIKQKSINNRINTANAFLGVKDKFLKYEMEAENQESNEINNENDKLNNLNNEISNAILNNENKVNQTNNKFSNKRLHETEENIHGKNISQDNNCGLIDTKFTTNEKNYNGQNKIINYHEMHKNYKNENYHNSRPDFNDKKYNNNYKSENNYRTLYNEHSSFHEKTFDNLIDNKKTYRNRIPTYTVNDIKDYVKRVGQMQKNEEARSNSISHADYKSVKPQILNSVPNQSYNSINNKRKTTENYLIQKNDQKHNQNILSNYNTNFTIRKKENNFNNDDQNYLKKIIDDSKKRLLNHDRLKFQKENDRYHKNIDFNKKEYGNFNNEKKLIEGKFHEENDKYHKNIDFYKKEYETFTNDKKIIEDKMYEENTMYNQIIYPKDLRFIENNSHEFNDLSFKNDNLNYNSNIENLNIHNQSVEKNLCNRSNLNFDAKQSNVYSNLNNLTDKSPVPNLNNIHYKHMFGNKLKDQNFINSFNKNKFDTQEMENNNLQNNKNFKNNEADQKKNQTPLQKNKNFQNQFNSNNSLNNNSSFRKPLSNQEIQEKINNINNFGSTVSTSHTINDNYTQSNSFLRRNSQHEQNFKSNNNSYNNENYNFSGNDNIKNQFQSYNLHENKYNQFNTNDKRRNSLSNTFLNNQNLFNERNLNIISPREIVQNRFANQNNIQNSPQNNNFKFYNDKNIERTFRDKNSQLNGNISNKAYNFDDSITIKNGLNKNQAPEQFNSIKNNLNYTNNNQKYKQNNYFDSQFDNKNSYLKSPYQKNNLNYINNFENNNLYAKNEYNHTKNDISNFKNNFEHIENNNVKNNNNYTPNNQMNNIYYTSNNKYLPNNIVQQRNIIANEQLDNGPDFNVTNIRNKKNTPNIKNLEKNIRSTPNNYYSPLINNQFGNNNYNNLKKNDAVINDEKNYFDYNNSGKTEKDIININNQASMQRQNINDTLNNNYILNTKNYSDNHNRYNPNYLHKSPISNNKNLNEVNLFKNELINNQKLYNPITGQSYNQLISPNNSLNPNLEHFEANSYSGQHSLRTSENLRKKNIYDQRFNNESPRNFNNQNSQNANIYNGNKHSVDISTNKNIINHDTVYNNDKPRGSYDSYNNHLQKTPIQQSINNSEIQNNFNKRKFDNNFTGLNNNKSPYTQQKNSPLISNHEFSQITNFDLKKSPNFFQDKKDLQESLYSNKTPNENYHLAQRNNYSKNYQPDKKNVQEKVLINQAYNNDFLNQRINNFDNSSSFQPDKKNLQEKIVSNQAYNNNDLTIKNQYDDNLLTNQNINSSKINNQNLQINKNQYKESFEYKQNINSPFFKPLNSNNLKHKKSQENETNSNIYSKDEKIFYNKKENNKEIFKNESEIYEIPKMNSKYDLQNNIENLKNNDAIKSQFYDEKKSVLEKNNLNITNNEKVLIKEIFNSNVKIQEGFKAKQIVKNVVYGQKEINLTENHETSLLDSKNTLKEMKKNIGNDVQIKDKIASKKCEFEAQNSDIKSFFHNVNLFQIEIDNSSIIKMKNLFSMLQPQINYYQNFFNKHRDKIKIYENERINLEMILYQQKGVEKNLFFMTNNQIEETIKRIKKFVDDFDENISTSEGNFNIKVGGINWIAQNAIDKINQRKKNDPNYVFDLSQNNKNSEEKEEENENVFFDDL